MLSSEDTVAVESWLLSSREMLAGSLVEYSLFVGSKLLSYSDDKKNPSSKDRSSRSALPLLFCLNIVFDGDHWKRKFVRHKEKKRKPPFKSSQRLPVGKDVLPSHITNLGT